MDVKKKKVDVTEKYGADFTLEQLANWDPDVIIVQDRYPEVYEDVTTKPEYAELKAVKDGNVILAPYWTKPCESLSRPSS